MSKREHILQWVIIYDVDGNAQFQHQFSVEGEQLHDFTFVKELGDSAKVLICIPKDQRVDSDKPIGSPFVAVDLVTGHMNVNGTNWDFLPEEIIAEQRRIEREKRALVYDAVKVVEKQKYDAMVIETAEWEDRDKATKTAKAARKLSASELVQIEHDTLVDCDIPPLVFRPIFFSSSGKEITVDSRNIIIKQTEPKFEQYKVGWQATVNDKNYQRVVYVDLTKNMMHLKEKR